MFRKGMLQETCSDILAASLPFITLGLLGDKLVLYVSVSIGVMALVTLIACLLLKNRKFTNTPLAFRPHDFALSYAFALSAAILDSKGIDASLVYWTALILAILAIGNTLLRKR